jgi:hypothetical protein
MKVCIKCGLEKPLEEYYRHPRMKSGSLNKCKACCRADSRANRESNREKHVEYDRLRFKSPARKKVVKAAQKRLRERHPEKSFAWNAVSNAVRDGRLARKPCEVCGDPKAQAHHDDYAKPLEVRWLCFRHHREGAHGQTVSDGGPLPPF